jgi:hypothetical protein
VRSEFSRTAAATLPKKGGAAGRTAYPHHNQIIISEPGLPQDRILGRSVEAQRGSDRAAVPVCYFHDLLQDRPLVAAGRRRPLEPCLRGAESDRAQHVECRHRTATPQQRQSQFSGPSRYLVAPHRDQDVQPRSSGKSRR